MLLLGLVEFACLVGIPVTLIGFVIQAIRKKPNKKVWGGVCIGFLAAMVICVIVTPSSPSDGTEVSTVATSEEVSEKDSSVSAETSQEEAVTSTETEETSSAEKTEAEEFAEENSISVELAESIEAALAESEHSYKLHQVIGRRLMIGRMENDIQVGLIWNTSGCSMWTVIIYRAYGNKKD